jgi:hypothetical protein
MTSDKPMTQAEVIGAIDRERRRLVAAVETLGDAAATLPVNDGGWTAKDVLGHAICWVAQLAFGLGAPLRPPPYISPQEGRVSDDEMNARAVAYSRERSLGEVRAEFDATVDALVDRLQLRTDSDMLISGVPWDEPKRPLWQQVGSETFLHWPEHTEDIERARAEPSA